MKQIGLFLVVFMFGCGTAEDKFDKAVKQYNGTQNIKTLENTDDEFINSVVIEKFSPQKDGNVVVLLTNGQVEYWEPKLLARVIVAGKANKKRYSK